MPNVSRSSILVIAAGVALIATVVDAGVARAQQPPVTAEQSHPRRMVSVTISPLLLVLPIVELTAEGRVYDKLGIGVVAGAGKVSEDASDTGPAVSARVVEVGLQGRYYLLGDFRHGLQLGAEGMYLHVSDIKVDTISAYADGVAIGPFVGYKYTADIGFTFDSQLGFQRAGLFAKASGDGLTATKRDSDYLLLLNLNVGWSL